MGMAKILRCECGWPRPLIGVTRADGEMPLERLRVAYVCPTCERPYEATELLGLGELAAKAGVRA